MKTLTSVIAVISFFVITSKGLCDDGFYVIPVGKQNIAPVQKTGQTKCYDTEGNEINCAGTGQDGSYQAGVHSPAPRFTDNGNGTVTDNLTGLIWTKRLSCQTKTWQSNLDYCNSLASGTCGLTDGSGAGVWRLANRNELLSLLDLSEQNPTLTNGHPFIVSGSSHFISSTSSFGGSGAFTVGVYAGTMGTGLKTGNWSCACVRGGL